MKYNKEQYQDILAAADEIEKKPYLIQHFKNEVRLFLLDAYKGPYICYLKKNFPELTPVLKKVAAHCNMSIDEFVVQELELTLTKYKNSYTPTIRELTGDIKASLTGNVFYLENNKKLFNDLTVLKELLYYQEILDEDGVLKRFSPKLKVAQLYPQYVAPTRLNVFCKTAELIKENQEITPKTLGPYAYEKLVYMAASDGLNKDEWISAFVMPYLNNKPLNVAYKLFETDILRDYVSNVKVENIIRTKKAPMSVDLLTKIGLTKEQALKILGIHKHISQISITNSTTDTFPIKNVAAYELLEYFTKPTEYVGTQKIEFANQFYIDTKILLRTQDNINGFHINNHVLAMWMKSNGINPDKFTALFPKTMEDAKLEQVKILNETAKLKVNNTPAAKVIDLNAPEYQNNSELIEKLKSKLLAAYPNKVVENLSYNTSLYQNVIYVAKKIKITKEELLTALGFSIKKRATKVKAIKPPKPSKLAMRFQEKSNYFKAKLLELYPDGIVINLKDKDAALYKELNTFCSNRKITLTKYIPSLGLKFISNADRYITEEHLCNRYREKLKNIYGHAPIKDLRKTDVKLYNAIKSKAKKLNMSVKSFIIEKLGLEYADDEHPPLMPASELFEELEKSFPDKKIDLAKIDPKLNSKLSRKACYKKQSIEEYAAAHGFTVVRPLAIDKHMEEVLNYFPNRVVIDLAQVAPKLHNTIYQYAYSIKTTMAKLFEQYDFKYINTVGKVTYSSNVDPKVAEIVRHLKILAKNSNLSLEDLKAKTDEAFKLLGLPDATPQETTETQSDQYYTVLEEQNETENSEHE